MDELRLLHRENQGNLLRKQDELLQKQQTVLRLLATANHHFISEIVIYLSLLDNSIEDLTIALPEKLTLQFSKSGVICQREARVDQIIRKALDNSCVYKDPDYRNDPYGKNTILRIVGIEKINNLPVEFSGNSTISAWLLTVVQRESDEYFWSHVEKLNYYFLTRHVADDEIHDFREYRGYIHNPVVFYIKELVKRCCLAISSEIVNRLQLYILCLITSIGDYLDEEETENCVKLFRPIFYRTGKLSKTASFQTIVDLTGVRIKMVPEITTDNLYEWSVLNQNLYDNMISLTWMTKYMNVCWIDDITDPALLQMALVLDNYDKIYSSY